MLTTVGGSKRDDGCALHYNDITSCVPFNLLFIHLNFPKQCVLQNSFGAGYKNNQTEEKFELTKV